MIEPDRVSSQDVEIVPVRCYIVKCPETGRESGVMRHTSDWNGMVELRGISGNGVMVLEAPEIARGPARGGFLAAFREVFPADPIKGHVLKASPDMIDMLLKPAETAKA